VGNYGNKKIERIRSPHASLDFSLLNDKHITNALSHKNISVIMGHVRAATCGDLTIREAHPFIFGGKFIGAHNGHITNVNALYQSIKERNDEEILGNVDSEKLLYGLYKSGDNYKEYLSRIEGNRALVWIHNDILYFTRGENPRMKLFFTTILDEKVIVYSSEEHFLRVVLSRNGIKTDKFFELPPFTVWKYNLIEDSTKPIVEEYKQMKRKSNVSGFIPNRNHQSVNRKEPPFDPEKGELNQSFSNSEIETPEGNISFLEASIILSEDGCANCSSPLSILDEEEFIFFKRDSAYGFNCCQAGWYYLEYGDTWEEEIEKIFAYHKSKEV
jgi:predicted glutamine amidotransferase